MCGGCNVLAEGAGVSVIMARYWWVARQGRRTVAAAEALTAAAAEAVPSSTGPSPRAGADLVDFDDPMPDLTRIT